MKAVIVDVEQATSKTGKGYTKVTFSDGKGYGLFDAGLIATAEQNKGNMVEYITAKKGNFDNIVSITPCEGQPISDTNKLPQSDRNNSIESQVGLKELGESIRNPAIVIPGDLVVRYWNIISTLITHFEH